MMPLPIHFEPKLSAKKIKKARYLTLFRRKYRERVAYSQVPESLRIAYSASLLTDDGKLFYVKNSKAGCTTIAQILHKYSKGMFCENNIHDERSNLKQYEGYWRSFEEALSGKAIAFTFVRHPEARLVSAFQNFFIDKRNRSHGIHLPALESRGFDEDNSQEKNFSIFLDYVEESLETDILYTDRHWRPQYINIAANDIKYSVIGKIENFQEDILKIFSLIDKCDFLTDNQINTRFNASDKKKHSLSAEDRKRVEKIYLKDYETFGY